MSERSNPPLAFRIAFRCSLISGRKRKTYTSGESQLIQGVSPRLFLYYLQTK
jgi:hypothetical protein